MNTQAAFLCLNDLVVVLINFRHHREKPGRKKTAVHFCHRFLNELELLKLDFFVFHMLASLRIKFHDQHFVGRGFFVFGGRVKMTGAGG